MGFGDLGRKLSKIGQDTKNGVQKVSDSVTISNRISQEKKSLGRLFALIGEAVYKESPDNPRAGLEDEWAAVKVAYANIATYTEQLNHVKGIVYCPSCGRAAASGDKYCAKCGFRLNIRPETTGAKVAKDLKEAGQEVGRLAGSAADRTGEAVGGAAAETKNAFSWLKGRMGKPKKDSEEEAARKTDVHDGTAPEEAAHEEAAWENPVQDTAAGENAARKEGDSSIRQPADKEPDRPEDHEPVEAADRQDKAGVEEADPVLMQAQSRNRRQKSAWKHRQKKS